MGIGREDTKRCIGCNRCRDNCAFLTKYQLNIGEALKREELAYSCFLCGKCTEVCPLGIDGRRMFLEMRQDRRELKYLPVTLEKSNYIFKNYRAAGRRALFPGCNFAGYYPGTTSALAEWLAQCFGIGVVYDCCTKPVYEMDVLGAREKPLIRLGRRLSEHQIEELIVLCPNCYWFLKEQFASAGIDIRIKSIYRLLTELGLHARLAGPRRFFVPCPERGKYEIMNDICAFLAEEPLLIREPQCCGAGGGAVLNERALAAGMAGELCGEHFHTYCATCSGNFHKAGGQGQHILLEILSELEGAECLQAYMSIKEEAPDIQRAFLNRAKRGLLGS